MLINACTNLQPVPGLVNQEVRWGSQWQVETALNPQYTYMLFVSATGRQ